MPQALEIDDFSGGITDNFLGCRLNQYQYANNLLVKQNKKFETRPGTSVYDSSLYQIPAGSARIGSTTLFSSQLFLQSSRNLYYPTTSWNTLTGPSGNPAIPLINTTNYISRAEWNGHLMVANDGFSSIQKIYKDENDTFRVRNAGLPKVILHSCITLANRLKLQFNLHISNSGNTVAYHSTADSVNTVTSSDAYDFSSLVTLVTELLTDYDSHDDDAQLAAAWSYHRGQGTTGALASTQAPTTLSEVVTRLNDLQAKYNTHEANATPHDNENTLQVPTTSYKSEPLVTGSMGSNSYIYTFVAHYRYTVGSTVFEDFGPTHQVSVASVAAPESSSIAITLIPVIANSYSGNGAENWDTANIEWYIYRTENGGTTHYFLSSVTNGTTSYTDSTSDGTLNDNVQIYTAGGVLDNDPPPPSKFLTVANDITWYGHVKEAGSIKKSRVRQSVKFDPDSCPESAFIDMEDEITGMGYVNIYPVVFCKRHIYRLDGFKDETGRGVINKREISRTVGAVNHQSIVNVLNGIYFASETGFYFTDGFRVVKLSTEFDDRYSNIVSTSNQKAKIYGEYDVLNNRVYWAVTSDSGMDENDIIYVLDCGFGIRVLTEDTAEATFTTINPDSDTWKPTALGFDGSGQFVITDSRGYAFKFVSGRVADPKIDTTTTPENWFNSAISFDYAGPAFNCGSNYVNKIATKVVVALNNAGNISLQIQARNNEFSAYQNLAEIRDRNGVIWRDASAPAWSHSATNPIWKVFPLIVEERTFNASSTAGIRFLWKQLRFKNSNTIIFKSDDYATVNVDHTLNTATLNSGSWPSDLLDYFISFNNDSYSRNFTISQRTSSVVTFIDANDNLTSNLTNAKWVIRGIPKNERLNLVSYSVEWEPITAAHKPYRGVTGGNA